MQCGNIYNTQILPKVQKHLLQSLDWAISVVNNWMFKKPAKPFQCLFCVRVLVYPDSESRVTGSETAAEDRAGESI